MKLKGDFHSINISDQAHIQISDNSVLSSFGSIEVGDKGALIIDDRVFFNEHCSIRCHEEIKIGKDTAFGDGVRLYDFDHLYSGYHFEKIFFKTSPIHIGKNCWIGANTVILKGVTIGDNVIIGANCVICEDIPANSIVTGQRKLNIRDRRQAQFRAFTYTASDQIEQLAYLVKSLPMVDFQIAAPTFVSPYLESFSKFDNVTLFRYVADFDRIEDLLADCDIYLDINHWEEIGNIVEKAEILGKPVLAFDNTVHHPEKTPTVSQETPEEMVKMIKSILSI